MLPISKNHPLNAAPLRHVCTVCHHPISDRYVMCLEHWRLVPVDLQSLVYITLGRARNARRCNPQPFIQRYREAVDTATAAVRLQLQKD